jgi:hypothetical protein
MPVQDSAHRNVQAQASKPDPAAISPIAAAVPRADRDISPRSIVINDDNCGCQLFHRCSSCLKPSASARRLS